MNVAAGRTNVREIPMKRELFALLLWNLCAVSYAQPGFLVDADWLAENIDDDKVEILEVRYHPHRYYTVGHIPGAVQVQRSASAASGLVPQ